MKNKRDLKGMTLVEVLISLAVLAMLSLVLLICGSYVDKTRRATTNLKDRIVTESYYASSRSKKYTDTNGVEKTLSKKEKDGVTDKKTEDSAKPSLEINVKLVGDGDYYVVEKNDKGEYEVKQEHYSNPEINLDGDLYSTKEIFRDGKTKEENELLDNSANRNHDLKFIDQITTQPASKPAP